jgi:hypothetical protein
MNSESSHQRICESINRGPISLRSLEINLCNCNESANGQHLWAVLFIKCFTESSKFFALFCELLLPWTQRSWRSRKALVLYSVSITDGFRKARTSVCKAKRTCSCFVPIRTIGNCGLAMSSSICLVHRSAVIEPSLISCCRSKRRQEQVLIQGRFAPLLHAGLPTTRHGRATLLKVRKSCRFLSFNARNAQIVQIL